MIVEGRHPEDSPVAAWTRYIFFRDTGGSLTERLDELVKEFRARHPGHYASRSGVIRDALEMVLSSDSLKKKLLRGDPKHS